MKTTALFVVAALLGCAGGTDPSYPDVTTLYRIEGNAVVCDGATEAVGAPAGGTFTEYRCSWELVSVDGVDACWAVVNFARPDAASPWTVVATFKSDARCD